jgi:cell division protein FtsI (penicillin-binding protein 3)
MYSSNLGSARMAVAAGTQNQQDFLGRLGILQKANIQLDEIATPHYPKGKAWSEVSTMTIAYGHGIAVSPLACVTGVAAIVNGGIWHPATLLKVPANTQPPGQRVISSKTSEQMRKLMRLVVEFGTAKFAAAPGYVVGGKTGTAEKNKHGRYEEKTLVSTFIGAFPMTDPRYVILALVDEPHGDKETHGYATAGWTVAPATSRIISRIAPLLGITPVDESSPAVTQALQVDSLAGKRIEDY